MIIVARINKIMFIVTKRMVTTFFCQTFNIVIYVGVRYIMYRVIMVFVSLCVLLYRVFVRNIF